MATGENFMMICGQRKKVEKIKVNKKEEQRIRAEIKDIENKRNELYENDNITDEELSELEKPLNERINKLLDSLY